MGVGRKIEKISIVSLILISFVSLIISISGYLIGSKLVYFGFVALLCIFFLIVYLSWKIAGIKIPKLNLRLKDGFKLRKVYVNFLTVFGLLVVISVLLFLKLRYLGGIKYLIIAGAIIITITMTNLVREMPIVGRFLKTNKDVVIYKECVILFLTSFFFGYFIFSKTSELGFISCFVSVGTGLLIFLMLNSIEEKTVVSKKSMWEEG